MQTRGTPFDKQARDILTLISAAQSGRRFSPCEIAMLNKSWLDAVDSLHWLHRNRQKFQEYLAERRRGLGCEQVLMTQKGKEYRIYPPAIRKAIEDYLRSGLSTRLVAERITAEGYPMTKNAVIGFKHRNQIPGNKPSYPVNAKPIVYKFGALVPVILTMPKNRTWQEIEDTTLRELAKHRCPPWLMTRYLTLRSEKSIREHARDLDIAVIRRAPSNNGNRPRDESSVKPAWKEPETMRITIPESRRVTIMELTATTCRWPTTVDEDGLQCFCGAPSDTSRPYCDLHTSISLDTISARIKRKKAWEAWKAAGSKGSIYGNA